MEFAINIFILENEILKLFYYIRLSILKDITYIIPLKINSKSRLINTITSVTYLLSKFPKSRIIIKEVDKFSSFLESALPQIKERIDTTNLKYLFEKNEGNFLHKTKILNELISISKTKIVASYDVDIIYPYESHFAAYNSILKGTSDIVYPFGVGFYQYKIKNFKKLFEDFLNSNFNFEIFNSYSKPTIATIDWCQFYNRQKIIDGYLYNEDFSNIHRANQEFFFRFNSFGYKVNRFYGPIWNLNAQKDSEKIPNYNENLSNKLWQKIRTKSKNQLLNYYEKQRYIKGNELNAC